MHKVLKDRKVDKASKVLKVRLALPAPLVRKAQQAQLVPREMLALLVRADRKVNKAFRVRQVLQARPAHKVR